MHAFPFIFMHLHIFYLSFALLYEDSHPDSLHLSPNFSLFHPDFPLSHPYSPHSHSDSTHSHSYYPHSHPDSHHSRHSVPRFPIPAFIDVNSSLLFLTKNMFKKIIEINLELC